MIPMSKEKFGIVITILTPLGLSLSVLAGYFIFHETYSIREIVGIGLTIIAVTLLASG